jgi:multidrug efflux pump subunit AcrA (membrane-fusion protein)
MIVYAVKNETIVETPVRTGEKLGDLVEILEGLKPGDKVVLNPPKTLKNGSKITGKIR